MINVMFFCIVELEKLQQVCSERPLEGSFLQMFAVPMSNCIQVTGFGKQTTKDLIMLYFENSKRSKGGPINKVELSVNKGFALVYFSDFKSKCLMNS